MTAKNRKRKLHARRTWLNTSTRMRAHVIGHVTHTYTPADPTHRHDWRHVDVHEIDGSLVISDCQRTVELDFDLYGTDDADGAELRQKVARLRASVVDFCDAMDKALDAAEVAA